MPFSKTISVLEKLVHACLLMKAPDIDFETDSESDRRSLKRSNLSKAM